MQSRDQNWKSIIRNFDLMIDLLVASMIMRLKFKINYLNLVSCTFGKFLALIISHLCIKTFDLMIALAANKSIMRSKFPKILLFEFWSHDQSVNLMINNIGQIRPHEQTQFWPHDRNFDLMKFDLLTPTKTNP